MDDTFDMYLHWTVPPSAKWPKGYDNYANALYEATLETFLKYEPLIVMWMKDNAQWQDHTGLARELLHVNIESDAGTITMRLAHGAPYGVFLEVMHQGVFSILGPALDYWAPKLWGAIGARMRAVNVRNGE